MSCRNYSYKEFSEYYKSTVLAAESKIPNWRNRMNAVSVMNWVTFCTLISFVQPVTVSAAPQISVRVVPTSEQTQYAAFRRVIVSSRVNPPKPYPGYAGFVGWTGITRTKSGALLVTFSSGYWHGSPPTGPTLLPTDFGQLFEKIAGIDLSTLNAPRGGRAEISRSEDGGITWSPPVAMIDTPDDDRSPSPVQLSDGTLIASFFTYDGKGGKKTGIIRSFDEGKTWEQTPHFLLGPFTWTATNGPPLEMPDKSILVCVYANKDPMDPNKPNYRLEKESLWAPEARMKKPAPDALQFGIFQSRDRGNTWNHRGILQTYYDLDESSIAAVGIRQLIMVARPEGAVSWSSDEGQTWTTPVRLPMRMYDPWLLTLRDGTLLCVYGSYNKERRGVRAILSPDGGKTWFGAGPDYGFSIDPSVYGYSRGVQLPDGSIYLVYQQTAGHKWSDSCDMTIFALRFRVLKDCRGIELLPLS